MSATLLVITTATTAVSLLSTGEAVAGEGAPVPVAGVDAFGIGYGQLGATDSADDTANFASTPDGIAVDAKGDLFAVDQADNRVIEYVPSSPTSYPRVGTVVAGAGGQGSGLNQLYNPSGVALDANGDLFVSDSANERVMEYAYNATTGTYASAGTVVAGTGTAGSGRNQLNDPIGLALDAKGDLFVADSGNSRVEEFAFNSVSRKYASTAIDVAGTGVMGSASNQLGYPNSVALDAKGDLFVADWSNGRVMEYTYSSSSGTFSRNGTPIGSPSGMPLWFAFDASGDLFLSYGYLGYGGVEEFAYNPSTGTFATTGTTKGTGDMVGPEGLAFNSSGDLFVAETSQTSDPSQTVWDMVLEFTYSPAAATFSPQGTVMGQVGRTNGGISGIAVDSRGNLFVSNGVSSGGGNPSGVLEFPFNPSTQTYSAFGTVISGTGGTALALDSNNDLFVAEATGVVEFPYSSASGTYPASGTAVPGATQLASLSGVGPMAFDSRNDLFVVTNTVISGSNMQGQVLEFAYNPSGGTWAATGTVRVTLDYAASQYATLTGLGGVALDANGDLFVSNSGTGQVEEYLYNAATGTYATTGITVAGVGGVGSGLNQLGEPSWTAVDNSGDLFVFDASGRVMEFTGNPATGAYAANGTVILGGLGTNYPQNGGVAADAQGDLFFADDQNSAVVYESAPPTTAPPTTATPTTAAPTTAAPTTAAPTTAAPTTAAPTTAAPTTATVPSPNLVTDPGFETAGVPADYWGSTLARSSAVVHSGSWALAQTTSSSSGGWDLDSNPSWYAPISSAKTYSASIWVRATAAAKVDLNVDLLTSGGGYVDSAGGPTVTLAPNTWTQLTLSGIKPASSDVYAGMEPNFSSATKGTAIYWDDMSLTSP
ncbi:MAG: NHL repeat-containing protein [Acidimicrobiales bacterium]